jgi:hypothetical protein
LEGWGLPRAIISDRDSLFTSAFWEALLKAFGIESHMTTAYHPQADGQAEKTNALVTESLRFYAFHGGQKWPDHLSAVTRRIANTHNTTLGRSPNEVIFGFTLNEGREPPDVNLPLEWARQREIHRSEAADSIAFAQASMKRIYDAKHAPLQLKPGDLVYLNIAKGLTPGYKFPGQNKLSARRSGPYLVKTARKTRL